MKITFETKVWEKDWELILKTPRLENILSKCNYPLDKRLLLINNVSEYRKVATEAERLVKKGVLTEFINVGEYAKKALDYFELTEKSLGVGYYYSIAELVSLYLADTKYLLHFSGDSIIDSKSSSTWLHQGIDILESEPQIKVVNLSWQKFDSSLQEELIADTDNYWTSFGFSDQMYLVRVEDFKQKIYNFTHPLSERYPKHAGELFEKRVDSWLRTQQYYRATLKDGFYKHRNFTNVPWKKNISILFGCSDLFS